MNIILMLASVAAFVSFCIHTFVGGRYAARPLLTSTGLPNAAKWLNYFTWHIVTVHLLVVTAVLACGAAGLVHRDAILLICILAGCVSVTSVAVTLKAGIPSLRFPASYVLGATAALSLRGATGSKQSRQLSPTQRDCARARMILKAVIGSIIRGRGC